MANEKIITKKVKVIYVAVAVFFINVNKVNIWDILIYIFSISIVVISIK